MDANRRATLLGYRGSRKEMKDEPLTMVEREAPGRPGALKRMGSDDPERRNDTITASTISKPGA